MRFASSLSTHPVTAHATGEVIGQVIEQVGRHPDLAVLFVTRPHAGALEEAADAVTPLLEPTVLHRLRRRVGRGQPARDRAGARGQPVGRPDRAHRSGAAVGRAGGPRRSAATTGRTARTASDDDDAGRGPIPVIAGWPDDLPFEPQALLLLGRPLHLPRRAAAARAWPMDTPACR